MSRPIKYAEYTATAVGTGIVIPLGREVDFWLSIASDVTPGVQSGTTVVATVTGSGEPDAMQVPYANFFTKRFRGNLIKIAGNGATIELKAGSEKVDVAPQTLGPSTQAINVTQVGGSAVVAGQLPTDIGVANTYAKTTQFPTALDGSGNFKIRALASTDNPDISVNQANALKVKPLATLIEFEALAPTAIAEATVETVEVTGLTTLALGQQVFFALASQGGPAVAAATLVVQYIAIKGHTSAKYYAVAYAGVAISGQFPVTTAEKLDIVARNSSAATGIQVAGSWEAFAP